MRHDGRWRFLRELLPIQGRCLCVESRGLNRLPSRVTVFPRGAISAGMLAHGCDLWERTIVRGSFVSRIMRFASEKSAYRAARPKWAEKQTRLFSRTQSLLRCLASSFDALSRIAHLA